MTFVLVALLVLAGSLTALTFVLEDYFGRKYRVLLTIVRLATLFLAGGILGRLVTGLIFS